MSAVVTVEVEHAGSLCYAMQQSAVRWLRRVALRNGGAAPLRDLRVTIALPGFVDPATLHVAELPAGAVLELPVPDLPLSPAAFANAVERTRGELQVAVERAGERLAVAASPIDVLAYNEWPGLVVLPALLAAFVAPNHPALPPLLQDTAARLLARTGSSALDGYQAGPLRARAIAESVHEAIAALGITYVSAPPSFEQAGQKVRTPEQVLGDRLATCLDLALLYAAVLEHVGLHPLIVLLRGHAFVGAWLQAGSTPEVEFGPAVELRKRVELGGLVVLECTLACGPAPQPAAAAAANAKARLLDDGAFVVAIDVAAARRTGIRPLPARRSAFAAVPPAAPASIAAAIAAQLGRAGDAAREADGAGGGARDAADAPSDAAGTKPGDGSRGGNGADAASDGNGADEAGGDGDGAGRAAGNERGDRGEPFAAPPPAPPKDRLEHWKSRLLDLSMFNRLLNFVETKKTVRLCAHDVGALEDRLQQGSRVRIHARPALGQDGDPRDLALASSRAGSDVRADYLAEELRAGRLRAELDAVELDDRLVEIFRHARTSLEESGANTLYLAIGFLKYFETRDSEKPRRAPLLLLPLVVERPSVQDGCRFVLDDAEPRLNRTLLEFLQRDFDLRVAIGETPPEGEIGVDVDAVLDAFRQAVLAMPRWEVEATACIGFFSFTKYLMWLDLADRDRLLQSPVLAHLVERPGAAYAQDAPEVAREELDGLDATAVFCPKDADSSQLAAVLAAAGGRSFVLEGPPGTGKSQTITNLIAQALAHGQRVLFVAEKRAALEVVQRRLADVGLAPFCLELHSSKSGPKAVLEQLRSALEVGQRREPAEWGRVAAELQAARAQLNELVDDLHRVREHGGSVFGALTELVRLRGTPRVDLPELLARGPDGVAAARAAVARLAHAAATLTGEGGAPCAPAASPWWGVRLVDWRPAVNDRLAPAIERLRDAHAAFAAALGPVVQALALTPAFGAAGPSRAQLAALLELARVLKAASPPPGALLRAADWRALDADLAHALALGRQRDAAWSPLAARWRRELLALDLPRLATTFARHAGAFVLVRWWRLRGPRAELAPVAIAPPGAAAEVRDDLAVALRVLADERALAECRFAAAALGAAWRGGLADWARVEAWLQQVRDVRRLLLALAPGALAPAADSLDAIARLFDAAVDGSDALAKLLAALQSAHDELGAALAGVRTLLDLDDDAAFGDAARAGYLEHLAARVQAWPAALPVLRDFCAWRGAADAAIAAGVGPLVAAHARGEHAAATLPPVFEASFLRDWLDAVHAAEPALARFRGRDHERAIAHFARLDQQAIELAAKVVVARLAANLPQLRDTTAASSELGVLEREVKKQRKHKPVRRLFGEIPGLLGRLAPCMLMSPLSVAQFLSRSTPRFDLVVFDEASQIPMWDAVGAIGRGTSLVVVGDSRQLPPTTFFQRLAQGDEIAADEIPEDLESVLDECGAAGLPRMHLDWHYRSRHESLIAFSNHQYYKNRLLTFPAPQAIAPGLGVRCVRVAGVYDRANSQQNRIEAEALVAEVCARLLDPARARHSLGIVTFSRAQQVLIEDLLDQARRERPELDGAFGGSGEPVFVKNLENVQGDERDVILFSICYGPDAQGRVYENYGPLNLQGGERRLNVAVTRARRELIVFTSVGPEQVATRTPALGARHLRTFLDYAQRGQAALAAAAAPGGDVESPFEDAVRDALVRRGHEVHTQIGCSGYRIDLAVVDRDAPGRYVLGIECDGATYHGAATARDRDRLRASVLRGLGWQLHRVWSTDFWQDPAGEIERVERAIAAARATAAAPARFEAAVANAAADPAIAPAPGEAPPAHATPPTSAPSGAADGAAAAGAPPRGARAEAPAPGEAAPDPDGPRPYTAAALAPAGTPEDFQSAAGLRRLRTLAADVLAAESPIAFDRLARTLADTFGLARVTDRVRERVRSALPPQAAAHDDVVWRDEAAASAFRGFRVPPDGDGPDRAAGARPADELPAVEIRNAMAWLLRQHEALSADDLAREAARCFGIARMGAVVREVMNAAVERLVADGHARRDGAVLRRR